MAGASGGGAVAVQIAILAVGSFVLALSGALVPGPMFSATVAGSHRRGFWFGPGAVLGHAMAELPVVLLLLAGLSTYLDNRWVLVVIGSVGAATLVWMGVGLIRQSRRHPDVGQEAGLLRFGAVLTGLLTTLLNPYWYLWWVTQPALLLVSARQMGWLGVGAFFIGHISADLAWYSATSLSVAKGRRLLQGTAYKALLIACAVILFVMAVLFARLVVEQWLA
jgi:threonine/homoserine/homoserine lactone efflux protein